MTNEPLSFDEVEELGLDGTGRDRDYAPHPNGRDAMSEFARPISRVPVTDEASSKCRDSRRPLSP